MSERKIELLIAFVIYVITMTVLLASIYHFLENWHLSEFNFFIAGALIFLVAIGWGYVLTAIIFAPKKQMENRLTTLSNNIMHELNIPLATIQANTSMLKKTIEDKKSLKRIQRIEDASYRLKRLYDELVYTIHKEIQSIDKEQFDIETVVQERVAHFDEQGRNTFVLAVPPYSVEMDKIGFEQMLDNILSNAMKYSQKSTPIYITLIDDKLCIKDKGIGMSTSELLRVHERYFQGDNAKEGKGIGLNLVKTYCDSEGIDIHIASQKDVGTEICLGLVNVHKNKSK